MKKTLTKVLIEPDMIQDFGKCYKSLSQTADKRFAAYKLITVVHLFFFRIVNLNLQSIAYHVIQTQMNCYIAKKQSLVQ